MPYANEHACRLEDPGKYDSFARKNCEAKHDDKCIDFIYGIKSGKSELQAMRYPKDIWTVDAARSHCNSHDGSFEAAKESDDMKLKKEIRNIEMPVKITIRADGTPGSIHGYPIVYGKDSVDMGFVERIAPGAAKQALKRSNIRGLKNHDPSLIFARQGVNLKFMEDANGLRYEATPIDTRNFKEVAEEVRLGLLTGQSFGFTVKADKWEGLDTDKPVRTITEIDQIYDVGPVTYPAYNDTTVALRSLEAAKENQSTFSYVGEVVRMEIDGHTFEFVGDDRLEKAIETIRSFISPKTAVDDNDSEPSPTTADPEDVEQFHDSINKLLERYK